jgi:hypothetical protein
MGRLEGLWVYQRFDRPDPGDVVARAHRHGITWLAAQAFEAGAMPDRTWLGELKQAAIKSKIRVGVFGYVGRPHPAPAAEAKLMADAIDLIEADFAIVDAEFEYEQSDDPVSRQFVDAYRARKPKFRTHLSSFGRPTFHDQMDWKAWAKAGFAVMPQAYENVDSKNLKPSQCVDDCARIFPRRSLKVTLGCYSQDDSGQHHPHLPIPRLVQSVQEIPGIAFNVFRHGTVTEDELKALARVK